jgi:hypothetical protein
VRGNTSGQVFSQGEEPEEPKSEKVTWMGSGVGIPKDFSWKFTDTTAGIEYQLFHEGKKIAHGIVSSMETAKKEIAGVIHRWAGEHAKNLAGGVVRSVKNTIDKMNRRKHESDFALVGRPVCNHRHTISKSVFTKSSKQKKHVRVRAGKPYTAGRGFTEQKYPVSYQKKWDDEGYVYDQIVKVPKGKMDAAKAAMSAEVARLNKKFKDEGAMGGDEANKLLYLKQSLKQKGNVIFTNHTQRDFISKQLGFKPKPRNTAFVTVNETNVISKSYFAKATKPYGHKQYSRITRGGKIVNVSARGVKPVKKELPSKGDKVTVDRRVATVVGFTKPGAGPKWPIVKFKNGVIDDINPSKIKTSKRK